MKKNVLKHLKHLISRKSSIRLNENTTRLIRELLARLDNYWAVHDLDCGTQHSTIFSIMYTQNKELSLNAVALCFYISTETVKRYVKRYNMLALKLINRDYPELINFL